MKKKAIVEQSVPLINSCLGYYAYRDNGGRGLNIGA